VHERLDDSDLLAVSLRQLPDRPVEDDAEALAERIPKLGVDAAAEPRERIELFPRRQAVEQPEISGLDAQVEIGERPNSTRVRLREVLRLDRRRGHRGSSVLTRGAPPGKRATKRCNEATARSARLRRPTAQC
jgi:hypothetical protein